MREVETLFRLKRSEDDFNRVAKNIFHKYKDDRLCVAVLLDIERRKRNLMAYLRTRSTPRTNNLIECFNSHLNGRLRTVKGFEDFEHADLWLNGYFIRRRMKVFTDCGGIFKKLNGRCSLEIAAKQEVDLPINFY